MSIRLEAGFNSMSGDVPGGEAECEPKQTEIARDLASLKNSVMDAARKRERLPQPLFWSLFHVQIHDIKRRKLRRRLLEQIFLG